MKNILIVLGFLVAYALIFHTWYLVDTVNYRLYMHDKISYEAMMCLQDKDCTLTLDDF